MTLLMSVSNDDQVNFFFTNSAKRDGKQQIYYCAAIRIDGMKDIYNNNMSAAVSNQE